MRASSVQTAPISGRVYRSIMGQVHESGHTHFSVPASRPITDAMGHRPTSTSARRGAAARFVLPLIILAAAAVGSVFVINEDLEIDNLP